MKAARPIYKIIKCKYCNVYQSVSVNGQIFFFFFGLIKYRGYKARASSSESCHMSALSNEDLSNTVIQCWGRRSDTEQDLRPVWFAPEVSEGLDGARYITGASWKRTTLVWSGSRTLTRWLMVSLVWKTIIQKDSRSKTRVALPHSSSLHFKFEFSRCEAQPSFYVIVTKHRNTDRLIAW